jgi:hypothetical protein
MFQLLAVASVAGLGVYMYINSDKIMWFRQYSPTKLHLVTGDLTYRTIECRGIDAVSNCSQIAEQLVKEMKFHYI